MRLLSVFLDMLPNNLTNGLCLTNAPFLGSKVDLQGFLCSLSPTSPDSSLLPVPTLVFVGQCCNLIDMI